jgi:hypothetical protein
VSGGSFKHYYEPLSSGALTADRPVDTFATRIAMDNVAHLVDSAPCYRINWMDPTGVSTFRYFYDGSTQAQYLTIAPEFPTTLMREGRYLGFDVRVAASVTSGVSAYITACIATPDVAVPISDPAGLGIIGFGSGFTTSADPEWVIDTTMTGEAPVKHVGMPCRNTGEYMPGASFGTSTGHLRCIVSALVFFENTDPAERCRIHGIQVREYTVE